jgi:WhiB family redox-sensing transcriptional regulator
MPLFTAPRLTLLPTLGAERLLPRDIPDEPQEGWRDQALCAETDPEAFFPEKGGSTRDAKAMCHTCDVRLDCLGYALSHDERFGIWGGLSERERRRLRTQRRSA